MNKKIPFDAEYRPVVVACRSIERELGALLDEYEGVEIRYLDQNLHLTPERMPGLIQEQVDLSSGYATYIVLGYGLCSMGIVGVEAVKQDLFVPRCHDCVGLFLGSPGAYSQAFSERPGTYYLTPGWISEKKDPLGLIENDYAPRMGREKAVWAMKEQLKHYTHISLIQTGLSDMARIRRRAKENAEFFQKEYEEIPATSLEYFRKILGGPYGDDYFFRIRPGEKINADMFLD